MTLQRAAAFPCANPEAWTKALTSVTLYAAGSPGSVLAVALIFRAITLPWVGCWTVLAREMRRVLASHVLLRAFDRTMATLLVASLRFSVA